MLWVTLVGVGMVAWAQQPTPHVIKPKIPPMKMANGQRSPFGMPFGQTLPSFGWIKEKWTSNDKPYLALRTLIDKEVNARKNRPDRLQVLVKQYENHAKKRPTKAQDQFAWAYSAYQASANGMLIRGGWGTPRDLSLALSQPKSPQSYQFARLRFLIAGWWRPIQELIPLSERLLQRNPKDYETKFYVVKVLSTGSQTQVRRAVRLAEEMVSERPNKRNSHAALADARWCLFLKTRKKEDGKAAIVAGETYLSMLPKDAPSRAECEDIIRSIRRTLSQQNA
jgi:hypothetical protein